MELAEALEAAMAAGRAAWPRITHDRGSFSAWTHAVGIDAGGGHADARAIDGLLARDASPELLAAQTQHREAFERALGESFRKLPARHKTLLRMHFLDGMNIDDIGVVFRVHRATVARWLVAIRRQVLDEISRQVSLDLRGTSSELGRLYGLLRSEVHVSIRRILRASGGQ